MSPNNINYLEIIKNSWKITWNNKYLWWFGLFMALGNGGFSFNTPFDGKDFEKKFSVPRESFASFINQHPGWVIALLLLVFILMLVFLALRAMGQAALIKSADNTEKGRHADFLTGFREGKKYFWRIFITELLIGLFILVSFSILFFPVGFLFYLKSFIIGTLTTILAIIIFVPLLILAFFIKTYGCLYIVLGNLSMKAAMENAYKIFCINFYSSIIMGLLFIPIAVLTGVLLVFILLFSVIFFSIIGLFFYLILNKLGIIIIIVLGLIFLLLLVLLIKSIYETFRQTVWVLFFREIALTEKTEIKEIVEEISAEKFPEPEGV